LGGLGGLVAGVAALAIPGIGPVIAVGPLGVALTALVTGATGALGGALTALPTLDAPDEERRIYLEGLQRGGVLVSVETDEADAARAWALLRQAGAVDVHAQRDSSVARSVGRLEQPPTPPSREARSGGNPPG